MKGRWIGSSLLLIAVLGIGAGLARGKVASIEASDAGFASQPEPVESIAVAVARPLRHRQTTTSIGTVIALRSITLRNEIAGTVRHVALVPGNDFGFPDHVRLSFATRMANIDKGLDRLEKFLKGV